MQQPVVRRTFAWPPVGSLLGALDWRAGFWPLGVLLLLALGALLLRPQRGGLGALVVVLLLLVVAAVAVWTLYRAAVRGPASLRGGWAFVAVGAFAAFLGQFFWLVERQAQGVLSPYPTTPFFLFILALWLFVLGSLLMLRADRAGAFPARRVLDAFLLVVLAGVLAARFGTVLGWFVVDFDALTAASPTWERILAASAESGPGAVGVLAAAQLGAVGLMGFALALAVWRDSGVRASAAVGLVLAAAFFAGGSFAVAADPETVVAGGAADLVWLGGWCCLGFVGVQAVRQPQTRVVVGRNGEELWKGWALPAAAGLVLAAIGYEVVVGGWEMGRLGLAGLGALGGALGARIGYGLRNREELAEQLLQADRGRILAEMGHALTAARVVDAKLRVAAEWVERLLAAPVVAIELLTEDGGTALELRAVRGLAEERLGARIPASAGIGGRALERGELTVWRTDEADELRPAWLVTEPDRPVAVAVAPLRFGERAFGLLSCARSDAFSAADLGLLAGLAEQVALGLENARLYEKVLTLSLQDPLTGVANRRQLKRDMAREFAAAKRGRRLVLALFDLDGFKEYNDKRGHLAGDEVLKLFGEVLNSESRAMNAAARYGGDEFVALLTDGEMFGAEIFAGRVADSFAQQSEMLTGRRLTVSYGLAEYEPAMQAPEDLIAAADAALYRAKSQRSGRPDQSVGA